VTRTYLDSGVLIAAARSTDAIAARALTYLDDPQRTFVGSAFVRLEVLPKPMYLKRQDEVTFYTAFFSAVVAWAPVTAELLDHAYRLAASYGLSAVDALHVAAALAIQADELVTTERPEKPIHRVAGLKVTSLFKGNG
jgi:predicted nucleic acid-binding protein